MPQGLDLSREVGPAGFGDVFHQQGRPFFSGSEFAGEIDAVGHRVVHGGERFKSSVCIDDEVLEGIEAAARGEQMTVTSFEEALSGMLPPSLAACSPAPPDTCRR